MLNEEIPVNKYQKKIDHMSKLVETMFIVLNCQNFGLDFEVFSVAMLMVSLHSMAST